MKPQDQGVGVGCTPSYRTEIDSGQEVVLDAPAQIWRVRQGLVGLVGTHSSVEALARPGDLLGVCHLLGGAQAVEVRGVSRAVVEALPVDSHAPAALLGLAYVQARRQHRELIGLQKGSVADRLRDLLVMLSEHGPALADTDAMALPALGVLAWVIDSTEESVCRVLARLRDLQVLETAAPGRVQRIKQDLRSLKPPPGMTASSRAAVQAFGH